MGLQPLITIIPFGTIEQVFPSSMLLSMVKLSGILLLAGLAAGIAPPCLAQDAPPVQTLAPALTTSSTNAPVTTLSIDLLAPQRVFTYDVTGASVFANALDPTVRSQVYGAVGETDTGIRDSSQTGQTSPYGSGGARLSALFSGSGAASRPGGDSSPAFSSYPPASQSDLDYGQPYGTDAAAANAARSDDYRSSWGASSAMGFSTSNASWGGRSGTPSRSGVGASSNSSSLASGYQSGSDLSSTQGSAGMLDPYRAQPDPNIGWRSPGLTRSRRSENAFPPGPTTFGAGSTDRFTSRPGQVSAQDPYASVAAQVGTQPEGSTPLRALAVGSSSPFGDFGHEDFLRPDILNAFSITSSTRKGTGANRQLRSSLGPSPSRDRLHTNSSLYGLGTNSLSSPSSRAATGHNANPYLTEDKANSVH